MDVALRTHSVVVSEMRKAAAALWVEQLQGLTTVMLSASCFDNASAQVCLCAV